MGAGAGAEPAGEEKEALQFGLVFVAWALAPGVEWPRLAPAPALGCHRRPRWRWTGRHLAALPGPGRAGGSARALHTARSSGWASAVLLGCLGRQEGADRKRESTPPELRRQHVPLRQHVLSDSHDCLSRPHRTAVPLPSPGQTRSGLAEAAQSSPGQGAVELEHRLA